MIARRDEFKRRRDYLYDALNEIGYNVPVKPQGAFYIYAECSSFCEDSYDFACKLLHEKYVAITPGIDFGVSGAKQHVRFAYTTSLENLEIGMQRLREFKK